jgi:succinoglycan biosynthesis transport protein ExoP
MVNKPTSDHSPGVSLTDIYYIIFRQKWKIITCSILGVLAALGIFVIKHPAYQSEAKLLIRYVMDNKSLTPPGPEARIKEPDERGDSIVNTEIEILTSFDLAEQVVDAIGVNKILGETGTDSTRAAAADLLRKNLTVEIPKNSGVIRIVFQHSDATIVQPVLNELIDRYLKRHVDIHQAAGVYDGFLRQQTEQLREQLAETDRELQKARNEAGVISLTDTKKLYTDQISKIRQDIFAAEAELAERRAALKDMIGAPTSTSATTSSNATVTSEATAGSVAEYKSLIARLDLLWKKQQQLLTQFTEESPLVKEVRDQIAVAEILKKKLEEENPRLATISSAAVAAPSHSLTAAFDPAIESARVAALTSKIQVLNSQLEQIRAEALKSAGGEATIQELQLKKELEEANYRHFAASLEQARFDEALGARKATNINVIQAPSPPFRAKSKVFKMMALAVLAGISGGFGLAFLIERKLDQSVRRPGDFGPSMRLPLFMSIPRIATNGNHSLPQLEAHETPAGDSVPGLTLWRQTSVLRRYYEALRDRLLVDFETRNLIHKPKLLAVTSCGKGSGVTTVAAGLAACLSETGDGNVLLVDMSQEHAAAQQFWKGSQVCGLQEALTDADRTQVQDNLHVVTEKANGDERPRNFHRQFTQLVPKLRASNYDYIIFDMPPVSQTSVTPRLSAFMDQVLLVIESEKTDRDLVRQAHSLLLDAKANVCAVLNKTQDYIPKRLHRGSLNDL